MTPRMLQQISSMIGGFLCRARRERRIGYLTSLLGGKAIGYKGKGSWRLLPTPKQPPMSHILPSIPHVVYVSSLVYHVRFPPISPEVDGCHPRLARRLGQLGSMAEW